MYSTMWVSYDIPKITLKTHRADSNIGTMPLSDEGIIVGEKKDKALNYFAVDNCRSHVNVKKKIIKAVIQLSGKVVLQS